MKKRETIWRLWAKSLGEKASKCDHESDKIALIRTVIFLSYLITNGFIIANALRHWNNVPNLNRDTQVHQSSECQRPSQKQDHILPLEVSPFRP